MFLKIFLTILIMFSILDLSSSRPDCRWHFTETGSYPAGYYPTNQKCSINNNLICCCKQLFQNITKHLNSMCNGINNECCSNCIPPLNNHIHLDILKINNN